MFGIERSVEMIDESNAIIHRRFITPLFYIGLKPESARFSIGRSECRVCWAYLSPYLIKKAGHLNESGLWEGYLCDELESVRSPYNRWVKA